MSRPPLDAHPTMQAFQSALVGVRRAADARFPRPMRLTPPAPPPPIVELVLEEEGAEELAARAASAVEGPRSSPRASGDDAPRSGRSALLPQPR